MSLPRRIRRLMAFMAIVGLLWSQFALAAHACPGMASDMGMAATHQASQANPHAGMPGCEQMAQAEPALCLSHCLGQHTSLDKVEAPVVLGPPATPVLQLAHAASHAELAVPRTGASVLTARAGAPPLAVLHCCFRI